MKRWDQTTLATNCGQAIEAHFAEVESLLAPFIESKKGKATATEKLLTKAMGHVRQMNAISDVVVGAASSRYPLQGVAPWMLEGAEPSIKHPFQEGLRREWLVAAGLEGMRTRLEQAVQAIRMIAHEMPDANPEEGLNRFALEQWIGAIKVVSDAFAGMRSVMFGGPLDALDWRELKLLELVPEPTRSELQMRLENRFDDCPAAALGVFNNDKEKMEAIEKVMAASRTPPDELQKVSMQRSEGEKIDREMEQANRAEARLERQMREVEQVRDQAHAAVEDDTKEEEEAKPPSQSILKGRRIAEQRELRRQEREAKKAAKKAKKTQQAKGSD